MRRSGVGLGGAAARPGPLRERSYDRGMIRVDVAEADHGLAGYLESVEHGETVVLCRRSVPVAEIRPAPGSRSTSRSAAQVDAARDHRDIATALERSGHGAIAARLIHLYRLVDEDPEEPGIPIESLRGLASFLLNESHLPSPRLGVGPEGFIQAEWRVPEDGMLALKFLPSGFIRFAAVSAPAEPGIERRRVNGTLPATDVADAVRMFTDLLVRPGDERQDHP